MRDADGDTTGLGKARHDTLANSCAKDMARRLSANSKEAAFKRRAEAIQRCAELNSPQRPTKRILSLPTIGPYRDPSDRAQLEVSLSRQSPRHSVVSESEAAATGISNACAK